MEGRKPCTPTKPFPANGRQSFHLNNIAFIGLKSKFQLENISKFSTILALRVAKFVGLV